MKKLFLGSLTLCMLFSCSELKTNRTKSTMNTIAENYVKLVLNIGQYDPDYVDAYYGPEEWKPAANEKQDTFPYDDLRKQASSIASQLANVDQRNFSNIEKQRVQYLTKQLVAVEAKIDMLGGKHFTFDEESKALYDAVAPVHDADYFESLLAELNKVLPGHGTVSARLDAFKKDFIIPKDKLDAVFKAAIREARKRTSRHIHLPENENFTVEYVTDKPWTGYNWYKGKSYSLIQVNTGLPIYIDRAIDLACHEGYPGHHVYNSLLEKHLVDERGWVEFSVYPLFSPQSLIAEGSANYGISVCFPGDERVQFERDVLFKLAGIDPQKAEKYYQIQALTDKLSYAGNEAARNYLDGKINAAQTIAWLRKYALMSPERAKQRLNFIEKYRSYVINYNLGEDIVKNTIESNGGTMDNPEKRWELFAKMLSAPETPSALVEQTND